ncbi:MAG: hypothetical protein HYS32_00505 [Candidatus Woesearchaeota archaeon]|nr:MAG: hypothetical protein HYS32_00505 [Candidatus Woesearchaeota archaeon]
MTLKEETIQKINRFVNEKPRTIQEIAFLIKKNWRTADRYVEQISKEQGTILTRTFREGTRGALKIVFWNNSESVYSTKFQEKLLSRILSSKDKSDFSPFDIYQYIENTKRNAFLEKAKHENIVKQDLGNLFRTAKQSILMFSGDLSWSNLKAANEKILDVIEEMAKTGTKINVLTNVDIDSLENTEKFLSINNKLGKELIEVRHFEQPLRAFIIDDKIARLKEVKDSKPRIKTFIFYEIYDKEWITWLSKVFWHMFQTAIPAERRIKDLRSIQELKIT